MTRYSPGHKDKTRAHLLETARAVFRERGFDSASIDTVMKSAGLTRGGFYAHFESKEALVREVLRLEPGLLTKLRAIDPSDAGRADAADLFDEYLDPAERSSRVRCPLVAHPMDALRGGEARAALYAEQVAGLVTKVRELLGPHADDAEDEAVLMSVVAVGAAILSSAVPDAELASKIEAVSRAEIRRRLGS